MNEEKSKSQLKRDAKALQDLGANMAQLPISQLDQIPLSEDILEVIMQLRKSNSNLAKKRYTQYLGRLMRNVEDMTPIQNAYNKIVNCSELNTAVFHKMETWRERLMSEDKQALTEFLQQHPCPDIQQLRLLIRQAKSERDHQKNLGASKALFRFIRELIT